MHKCSVVLRSLMLGGLAVSAPPTSLAQANSNGLDVSGFKLGMTVDQAKARLKEVKPDIWLAVGSATEDRDTWSATGILPQFEIHDAEIHVPVFIGAGAIDKAYTQTSGTFAHDSPLKEIKDKNTPIDQFSGEFFNLFFHSD